MMQRGLFAANACYYYGDHVPNFAQLKSSDPAHVLPGYDYDVITADAVINRLSVKDGRLMLPDGMSYRVLVLLDQPAISRPVLRKVKALVEAGATVIGPRPVRATGLTDYPQCDAEVAQIAQELWGPAGRKAGAPATVRQVGKGRIISGRNARQVLLADGVKPDFEFTSDHPDAMLDYIHRRDGEAEIYFVANRSNRWENVRATFRIAGKAPELWDAVSGEHRFAAAYEQDDGRTTLPLELPPCGSMLVVFREPAAAHPARARSNTRTFEPRTELTGPWTVHFDPKWGGPKSVQFDQLVSWPSRSEPGIKFYSGTATYTKTFDLPAGLQHPSSDLQRLWLDLGQLRELAEVRLNGRKLGIIWAPPFRVDITDAVRPTGNQLEVDIVNFWPNRIIGDASLPPDQRLTKTNIRKLTKGTPLMESGLFGPVRLETTEKWARGK